MLFLSFMKKFNSRDVIGGSTFCALATLTLTGKLHDVLSSSNIEKCKKWLLSKQELGFHGRANKPDDSCYSFWIGASLSVRPF